MPDERYAVELDLSKVGDFKLAEALTSAGKLDKSVLGVKGHLRELSDAGGKFMGALDGAATKMMTVAKYAVMAGGAAAIGGLTYGVFHLNKELQNTSISLGTIFSVRGVAANVPKGIEMAKDQIAKMRTDARDLPGEFEDLMQIFSLGSVSAFGAGMTPDQWRQLSGKVMVAAKTTGMDMGMAAREFTQLMEGHAGSHNVFGTKLLGLTGAKATAFNQKTAAERLKILSPELSKYGAAIPQFSKSYDAASSTAVDNLKTVALTVTGPLFEKVTSAINEFNEWFSENQSEIVLWANHIALRLGEAFDWGKRKFHEYWPLIVEFAEVTYERLTSAWKEIEPFAKSLAAYMKDALSDPNGTIDKLLTLAKIYLALKGGSMVYDAASGAVKLGMAANGVLGGLGAGGAAAGGAAAAEGGLFAGVAAGAATAGVALAALAAAAGVAYVAYKGYEEVQADRAKAEDASKKQISLDLENIKTNAEVVAQRKLDIKSAEDLDEMLKGVSEKAQEYRVEADATNDTMAGFNAALLETTFAALQAAAALGKIDTNDRRVEKITDAATERYMAGLIKQGNEWDADHKEMMKKKAADAKHPGGMTVQKVEIVITTNQNPSRIARAVRGEFLKVERHATASRWVPNYSR